jgi:hypothetical protein
MKATAKFEAINSIDVTMTVTMSLGEWKELEQQLEHSWPACDLKYAIRELVRKADVQLRHEPPGEEVH